MKYRFIATHQQEYSVKTMCRALVVAVRGYYAWLRRAPSRRSQENTGWGERIVRIYHANRQVYGSPRIHAALRAEGQPCGKKRVALLMCEHGLSAKPRKHRTRTTDSQHEQPVAPNLLNREFTATAPNTKWVADITAIWTMEGWLYLAAVLDIFSRLVVGWAMDGIEMKSCWSRPLAWRSRGDILSPGYCTILIAAVSIRLPTIESCSHNMASW